MGTMNNVPVMPVGKYAGKPIDQLPNGYLRWVISQKFPPKIVICAKKKLDKSNFDNSPIHVTRHAIDMFSMRFIDTWMNRKVDDRDIGLATFMAIAAEKAWRLGLVSSKHRHPDDCPRRDHNGIRWVYQVSPLYPEYKEVITCMEAN